MAQICEVGVFGNSGDEFTVTGVDGSWKTLINADSLSLWEVLEGVTLTGYCGSYTTGCGMIRIINTVTQKIKAMGLLNILTEEVAVPFDHPVTVQKNDVIQVFTGAVA